MANEKYPTALSEGSVLAGRFIIEEVLGQGGFGITYRAKDHNTDETVAIKEYFPDTMVSRNESSVIPFTGEREENFKFGLNLFLQEAETLAKYVDNDGIVSIKSYFEENGTAYFVMEFVEGISFDGYLKEQGGKISYKEAENILLPVIDALGAVHKDGIVHRDVTPDNIYITNEGKVKLLDFGAARYSIGDKSRSLDVVLKHGYAPKEQYTRHGKQGPFTDIYTVGVCFYKAITGVLPEDSIDRIEEDDVKLPHILGVEIEPLQEEAIMKAMAVQPAERFQSMEEFKRAILRKPVNYDDNPDEVVVCPNCGTTNSSKLKYCKICSEKLSESPNEVAEKEESEVVQRTGKKKSKKKIIIIVAAVAVVLLATIVIYIVKPCLFKGHKFVNATCTVPKYCSVCNYSEGTTIPHVYADATCTKPKTCLNCGATDGKANGHTFSPATCDKAKTCITCGVEAGYALGHSFSVATCTKAKTCSRCGKTEGTALGHSYVITSSTGRKNALKCSVCGDKTTELEDLPKSYATDIVDLINENREALGIKELTLKTGTNSLAKVAKKRAEELAELWDINERPDGSSWETIFTEYGVSDYGYHGYSIFKNKATAEEVVNSFSSTNPLYSTVVPFYKEIAVGYYIDDDGTLYTVLAYYAGTLEGQLMNY